RHTYQRSRQVCVGETNGLEHGTGRRAVRAIGDVTTVVFEGIGHGSVTPVGKFVCITAQAGALWYYVGKHSPHERKRMVLSQLCPARVRWLWYVLICVMLSGCSPTYHFRYQYTMVAPDGSNEGFENERVRVRVTPSAEAGVLQLAVLNKS